MGVSLRIGLRRRKAKSRSKQSLFFKAAKQQLRLIERRECPLAAYIFGIQQYRAAARSRLQWKTASHENESEVFPVVVLFESVLMPSVLSSSLMNTFVAFIPSPRVDLFLDSSLVRAVLPHLTDPAPTRHAKVPWLYIALKRPLANTAEHVKHIATPRTAPIHRFPRFHAATDSRFCCMSVFGIRRRSPRTPLCASSDIPPLTFGLPRIGRFVKRSDGATLLEFKETLTPEQLRNPSLPTDGYRYVRRSAHGRISHVFYLRREGHCRGTTTDLRSDRSRWA